MNDASALSTVISTICGAIICLLPFAAIGGGVFFFVKRRNKAAAQPVYAQAISQAAGTAPAPAATAASAATAAPAATAASEAPSHFSVSPSELVLLRADGFSPSAGMLNSYKMLGTEKKVDAPALVKAMFAAAFLALAEAGDVRLEMRKRKVTLGLREVDSLYIVPAGNGSRWPSGSFEQRAFAQAVSTAGRQANYVHQIVYNVVGEDTSYPWGFTIEQAQNALAARGILGQEKVKQLIGSRTVITLPPQTQAAAQQADIAPLQALLTRWQQSQPELWKVLTAEINSAVKSRTESSSSDGPDFD